MPVAIANATRSGRVTFDVHNYLADRSSLGRESEEQRICARIK
jgi:hypothetical protein